MTAAPEDSHPLYQKSHPGQPASRPQRPRRAPQDHPILAYLLIAVNALIFLAGYLPRQIDLQLFAAAGLIPAAVVEQGQIYRLLTAMFLHINPAHIFFNMYALYIVGSALEPIFGRLRLALIYLLGGLTGSVMSLALGDYAVPSVGASGAVFAILAAEALHLYRHRRLYVNAQRQLYHLAFLMAINLLIGFLPGARIDNWGHIGGMLGGLALAWQIAPRLNPRQLTALPKSIRDLAKTDANPLHRNLPALVIYVFALAGLLALTMTLLAP